MSDPRIKPRVPSVNWEHPLARGLVGAWAFQDGGGSVLRDVSNQGRNGVLTNMDPATDWVVSPSGGALDFDGSGDYVLLPDIDEFKSPAGTGLTASVWAKIRYLPGYNAHAFVSRKASSGAVIVLVVNGSSFCYGVATNSRVQDTYTCVPWQIAIDTWYHMVVIRRPSGVVEGWLNGIKHTAGSVATGDVTDQDTGPRIGGSPYSGGADWWPGQISHCRFWNRALLPNEVEALYYDKWAMYRSPEPVLASAPSGMLFEFDQLTGGMPDLRGGMV